jgi:hypothetical protein
MRSNKDAASDCITTDKYVQEIRIVGNNFFYKDVKEKMQSGGTHLAAVACKMVLLGKGSSCRCGTGQWGTQHTARGLLFLLPQTSLDRSFL